MLVTGARRHPLCRKSTHEIKRPESVVDKIQRHPGFFTQGLTENSFHFMNDTVGIRVVLYFLRHLPAIDREIRQHNNLEVSEAYPPKAYLNADLATRLSLNHLNPVQKESGYASLHYILRLRQSAVPIEVRPWFELQVRTLTEHTWGEIEHILGYKPDKRTSFAVKKQFQIISKLLEAIDEHFNFLFEELLRFQVEVAYEENRSFKRRELACSSFRSRIGLRTTRDRRPFETVSKPWREYGSRPPGIGDGKDSRDCLEHLLFPKRSTPQ